MSRQSQSLIFVSVELTPGKMTRLPDPFDKRTGGDADSGETKYKPGGMGPEVPLGGTPTVSNVTVTRYYDLDRDHDLATALAGRVGRAKMSVSDQPLDANGIPVGKPRIWTGILKTVNFPDSDSGSDTASTFDLVCSTGGRVS